MSFCTWLQIMSSAKPSPIMTDLCFITFLLCTFQVVYKHDMNTHAHCAHSSVCMDKKNHLSEQNALSVASHTHIHSIGKKSNLIQMLNALKDNRPWKVHGNN